MLEVNPFWSLVLLLGVTGWITSAVIFIYQAWDENDEFQPRGAMIWGGVFFVFYALWVVGLVNA